MKTTSLLFIAICGTVIFASCSRERNVPSNEALSQVEEVFRSVDGGVEELADDIAFRSDSDNVFLPACVTITDSGTEVYPRTITLDFGNGCTDALGRTRTGMMHVSISQPWTEVGSTREVTFENFTVTRPMQDVAIGVEGLRELVRLEPGLEGESRWERTMSTVLTHPEFTVNREFTGIRRWIQGEGDPNAGQVFGLTGEGTQTRNGTTRTRTILEELVYDVTCGETVSGSVEIVRPILSNGVVDFGDGECDGSATLTIGNATQTIDL